MITQKIGATHGFDANSVFCPTNDVTVIWLDGRFDIFTGGGYVLEMAGSSYQS
jgi:hypothetical protein